MLCGRIGMWGGLAATAGSPHQKLGTHVVCVCVRLVSNAHRGLPVRASRRADWRLGVMPVPPSCPREGACSHRVACDLGGVWRCYVVALAASMRLTLGALATPPPGSVECFGHYCYATPLRNEAHRCQRTYHVRDGWAFALKWLRLSVPHLLVQGAPGAQPWICLVLGCSLSLQVVLLGGRSADVLCHRSCCKWRGSLSMHL